VQVHEPELAVKVTYFRVREAGPVAERFSGTGHEIVYARDTGLV
jgi:hypothetical protein